MSAIDTSLYTYLASLADIVQEGTISDDKSNPRVWFGRRDATTDLLLNGDTALTESNFDVEVSSLDIDTAQSIAETLKLALNGYQGNMDGTEILGAFVNEANDDYIPKSLDADEGYHTAAFTVQIFT